MVKSTNEISSYLFLVLILTKTLFNQRQYSFISNCFTMMATCIHLQHHTDGLLYLYTG